MRTTIAAIIAGSILTVTAPVAAYATPSHTSRCDSAGLSDHLNKTDNGHGTPAVWADLSLSRYTGIKCVRLGHYEVLLTDEGTLRTRPGAGVPNGTGGQISHRVRGRVHGVYRLTVTGQLAVPTHRDTTVGSTAYVTQLFKAGAQVVGGEYAWTYTTRCERWVDSSKNDDGQGAAAGNITGKRCRPHHRPRPTPTRPTPSPTGGTPSSGGEAPPATPVKRQPAFTG